MEDCKLVLTLLIPHETFNHTTTENKDMDNIPYHELIGVLTYLSNATHTDIVYATNTLNKFNTNPAMYHWKAAKQVLRYLKNPKDYGITHSQTDKQLKMFVDSDWTRNKTDKKSR